MLEPIFGGLNLVKMDLGGLFLKDHLLRIDSIHQRWMLEPIFGRLNLVKMDLGRLFLKDHLLRIDSIHQK